MPAEAVIDASVAVKWFIPEEGSAAAREIALSFPGLVAPEFVLAEIASVAAKRLRRGDIERDHARAMVEAAPEPFTELVPLQGLTRRGFELAEAHGFSVYDALYLTLAEQRGSVLVTADSRLAGRARAAGLGDLVTELSRMAG